MNEVNDAEVQKVITLSVGNIRVIDQLPRGPMVEAGVMGVARQHNGRISRSGSVR